MNDHYDALEARDPQLREAQLMARLPTQLANAVAHASAFTELLQGIDPQAIASRRALAALPVTRKHELLQRQQTQRASDAVRGPQRASDAVRGPQRASDAVGGPQRASDVFGGFSTIGWGAMPAARRALRVFSSPGPIYEPEGAAPDYWRMARALFAAGFRAGDLAHNCFSYHFTPAGAMMESGAHAVGCTVFPGGIGQTEQQVQAIAELKPVGYIGTPSFLKLIIEKAAEMGVALPSLTKASVGGEAFPPMLRDWLRERGVDAYQSYGTADLGLIAYETSARQGMVIDEGVIVEIVRPGTGTGDPLPDGEVGEVVVTTLNPAYPLIRFGTGDLSAVLSGACPTGRTNTRIKGWMGRADQTAKVRGMFVHPAQVAEIARRFPVVGKARLVVSGEMANDRMALHVEVAGAPEGLVQKLTESIRDVTKLRGEVLLCAPGSLPNDGKVIEDARRYE